MEKVKYPYKKRFAKELKKGMRRDGLTIDEVCQIWNIPCSAYERYIKDEPDFSDAHDIGERDFRCHWQASFRSAAQPHKKGNTGIIKIAAASILGYAEKNKADNSDDEPLRMIKIEIFPRPATLNKPEDIKIIEGEVVQSQEIIIDASCSNDCSDTESS